MTTATLCPARAANAADLHGVTSASKLLSVLNAFRGDGVLLGVSQVAERAEVSKPTAHRLLTLLVRYEYVEHVGVRYRLGRSVFELGNMVADCRPRNLRAKAMPFLTDLYEKTHAPVHLGVLEGKDILILEKLYGHQSVKIPTRVGGRLPAICTSLGKAVLAFSPRETVANALMAPIPRYTARTVTSQAILQDQFGRARTTGIAHDNEGIFKAVGCVAAPIIMPGSNTVVGAVSLSFPVDEQPHVRVEQQLRRAATAIGAGYQDAEDLSQRPA
jgi:DNA-binding IclR family transcriptional regulator